MINFVIKCKNLYLTAWNYSNLFKCVTSFTFANCFENAIKIETLEEARYVREKIGIGEIYRCIDVIEPIDYL